MKNILQIIVGLGLIISGVFQELSIITYEVRIYELLTTDWIVLPFLARFIIALEIYLGISLVFNVNPKRINTYLLLVFSAFLLYDLVWDLFFNSNRNYLNIWPLYKVFGTTFVYYKALVVLPVVLLSAYLWKNAKSTDIRYKWVKYTFIALPLAFVFIIMAIFPYDFKDVETENVAEVSFSEINEYVKPDYEKISDTGNQILLFISLGCPHCFETTRKLAVMKRKYPKTSVKLVLFDSKDEDVFQQYANSNFEFLEILPEGFIKVTGGKVPAILHVKDGEVIKKWDGKTFNYTALSYVQNLKQ